MEHQRRGGKEPEPNRYGTKSILNRLDVRVHGIILPSVRRK